jgi:hypothetical protein
MKAMPMRPSARRSRVPPVSLSCQTTIVDAPISMSGVEPEAGQGDGAGGQRGGDHDDGPDDVPGQRRVFEREPAARERLGGGERRDDREIVAGG